jgi:hypothetical protein
MTKKLLDYELVQLGQVLPLLELNDIKLSIPVQRALHSVFCSLPFASRAESDKLNIRIILALNLVHAIARDQSKKTIAETEWLQELVKNISFAVFTLHPVAAAQGHKQ